MKHRFSIVLFLLVISSFFAKAQQCWSKEKAIKWQNKHGWLCGANFIPSTAVNQLEMWQRETFDPETIDRELGYAESIGFNVMRVYLHHVAWIEDPKGFKSRLRRYLKISERHHIRTMFVFFDDCWRDQYRAGIQPAPIPGVHNSQWLKDPGSRIDSVPMLMDTLELYVKDVLSSFRKDSRVLAWDLYNEPGHFGHGEKSWPLLKNVVSWARSLSLSQPITMGIWNKDFKAFNDYQIENSDVVSFHNYRDSTSMQMAIDSLKTRGKPLICSEYMKRVNHSTFLAITPMLKREKVGAINWGLVGGKTQTNYPQGNKGGELEPELWYHDIFRKDGSPFREEETDLLHRLTKKN